MGREGEMESGTLNFFRNEEMPRKNVPDTRFARAMRKNLGCIPISHAELGF